MDTGVDGFRTALLIHKALADGQQLDGVASLVGGRDVIGGDLRNTLAVDIVEGQAGVEAQGCQDGSLRGGVVALHVSGGIGPA